MDTEVLYDKLIKYTSSDVYPMHMPGHKRNHDIMRGFPVGADITEIDGFDDLQQPQNVLRETSELAAKLYGSDKAFLSVNGSTACILAAIGGMTRRGDRIIMARNCHMSVHNTVAVFGLRPTYIMPCIDEETGVMRDVSPAAVEAALADNRDAKLVVITSPTYEGVVSDVAAISGAAHKHGVPLFVDSAHGAHFGFSAGFYPSAVAAGADAVAMSLHKTLPALTQCSLLHVSSGIADVEEIQRLLSVFQTSSPSYVLMASIDKCLRTLETSGEELFQAYEDNLASFYITTAHMKNLRMLWNPANDMSARFFAYDPGKLVICTGKTHLTGAALMSMLRSKYKIELEMAGLNYALAMTSVCDAADGFRRLADALIDIDSGCKLIENGELRIENEALLLPCQASIPSDALAMRGKPVSLSYAVGAVSLEYVWAYPPGIPLIVPGEVIDTETVSYITRMHRSGVSIKSTKGRLPEYVYVTKDVTEGRPS